MSYLYLGSGVFHDDEMNDEHFPFVIELGNVHPAEMVSPPAVVERGNAAVIRPDVQSSAFRILPVHKLMIFHLISNSRWELNTLTG